MNNGLEFDRWRISFKAERMACEKVRRQEKTWKDLKEGQAILIKQVILTEY